MNIIDRNSATELQYQEIIKNCKSIFIKKHCDYGASWYILRLPSLTDQISIKANRIRSIQEKNIQMVNDSISDELIGIVNYCIMALIKYDFLSKISDQPTLDEVSEMYDKVVEVNTTLLKSKNHDYDEAWRTMRLESIIDIMLVKLLRIKHIEDNFGKISISEGVDSNYRDIINYSIFCLIKIKEATASSI